jgi:hypothetical protein
LASFQQATTWSAFTSPAQLSQYFQADPIIGYYAVRFRAEKS